MGKKSPSSQKKRGRKIAMQYTVVVSQASVEDRLTKAELRAIRRLLEGEPEGGDDERS